MPGLDISKLPESRVDADPGLVVARRPKKRVGVLALQGDFEAHAKALQRAGAEAVEVRSAAQLKDLDGLIIPGGESTTMLKLIEEENLFEPLREFGRVQPIFGTCAGAILLASERVESGAGIARADGHRRGAQRLRAADGQPDRALEAGGNGGRSGSGVYPRADHPARGRGCEGAGELSRRSGAGGAGPAMVATFHPELTEDPRVTRCFWISWSN